VKEGAGAFWDAHSTRITRIFGEPAEDVIEIRESDFRSTDRGDVLEIAPFDQMLTLLSISNVALIDELRV